MHCPWLAFLVRFNGARFRGTGITEYLNGTTVSVRFDAHGLHHLAPLLDFLGDELPEVGRRTGKRRTAQVGKPRVHLWVGEGRIDLFVEFVDDLSGRIPRCAEAPHCARFVVRDELAHSRYVWQRLRSRGCGDRQGTHRGTRDVPDRLGRGDEEDRNLPGNEVGELWWRAAIGYVHQINAGHHLEQLARKVA